MLEPDDGGNQHVQRCGLRMSKAGGKHDDRFCVARRREPADAAPGAVKRRQRDRLHRRAERHAVGADLRLEKEVSGSCPRKQRHPRQQ